MKKILIVVLAVVCVFTLVSCVNTANESTNTVPDDPAEEIEQSVTGEVDDEPILSTDYITYVGDITEVKNDGEYMIRVVQSGVAGGEDMYVKITDETVIADNDTELKEGDRVCVVTSAATTKSIPAQANGLYIVRADEGTPNYIKVGKVEKGDDGSVLITKDTDDVVVTLTKDVPATSYPDGSEVNIEEIKEGDNVFAWYEMSTLSMPAQATADKVLVIK